MSQNEFWKRNNTEYNPTKIAEILKTFRSADLADPDLSRRWIEFAKTFSQVKLLPTDIEQMSF